MEKALYAVDELSGFILACAYVRPEGLVGMTAKSVKKKMKQPSFAAAVGRDEHARGRRGARGRLRRARRDRDRGAGRATRCRDDAAAERPGPIGRVLARMSVAGRMADAVRIVVLDGDETGQELLEQSPAGARPELLGLEIELEHFDLSLDNRRATRERSRRSRRRPRCARPAWGSRRRRSRPRASDDVGSPEPDPARGDRRQGDRPDRPPAAGRGADRRRPLPDLGRADGGRGRLRRRAVARGRAGRRRRGRATAPSASPARPAGRSPSSRSAPRRGWTRASTADPSGRSPRSTRGCSRRRWTRPRPPPRGRVPAGADRRDLRRPAVGGHRRRRW